MSLRTPYRWSLSLALAGLMMASSAAMVVDLQSPPASNRATLTGVVKSPKGTPVEKASVTLFLPPAQPPGIVTGPKSSFGPDVRPQGPHSTEGRRVASTNTDAQGRFTLNARPGNYRLIARHNSGFKREDITLEGGKTKNQDITLEDQ